MDSQVKPVCIDLGAGPTKHPGSFGVDFCRRAGVDLLCDLEQPLPFRSDSVDTVYSSHVVEHVRNFVSLMEEVYRICRPGGYRADRSSVLYLPRRFYRSDSRPILYGIYVPSI